MSGSYAEVAETSAAWALADRIVQACVETELLGEAVNPVRLGRYRILRPLGAGGMGRLLLASDPDLDRQVALKLIVPALARSAEARQRIVAEARAMARLSDPNVAQVYEVSEADGQLFVALEYIQGSNLRAWLDAEARPWPEVVDKFRQAGSGLAAAHDKGITHRDFKPDNVMVQSDGRVRVVDFGLAQSGREALATNAEHDAPFLLDEQVTRTGARVGTPAYMAPEQWEGSLVDAQTDQFAFCVALFEAVAGHRPFDGTDERELRAAHAQATLTAWPKRAPAWLRRALVRGLSNDPARRWPDMRALLAVLDPARRKRRSMVAGVGVLIVASASVGLSLPSDDPCAAAGSPIIETWDKTRAAAISEAMLAAAPTWGGASAALMVERLDRQAQAWTVAARGVCAAEQAGDLADATSSQRCLTDAHDQLADTVAETLDGDPALLVSSVARAELLVDPKRCLGTVDHPPPTGIDDVREQIVTIERSLGAMSVPAGSESYLVAIRRGYEAVEAITSALDHVTPSLAARAGWVSGRLNLADGDSKQAERYFRRALGAARAADDEALAAAITIELIYAVGRDRERFAEAEDLADEATGMLAALGEPPLLRARLDSHRASAIAHAPEADRAHAVTLHERALATTLETLGPAHPQTIAIEGNLGAALNYAGRAEEAEQRLREALTMANDSWGATHPRTATLLGTLGLARMRQGDLPGAHGYLLQSLEIRRQRLGDTHPQVDSARYNLASVLRRQQRHDEALLLLEPALARAKQRDDARVGPWWVATGESALAVGNMERAHEALTAALRVFERTGASAADYARVRLALGRSWADDDPKRARMLAERARADAIESGSATRKADVETFLATLHPTEN